MTCLSMQTGKTATETEKQKLLLLATARSIGDARYWRTQALALYKESNQFKQG